VADDPVLVSVVADLDLFTAREIVALTLNVDAELRENPPRGTPVDTGWARANWVPSLGEPAILEVAREPTEADVAARAADGERGRNSVLAYRPGDGVVFVTNNVPYIGRLNDGHSPQQAPGFVQRAVEKAVRDTYSAGASKAARYRRGDAASGATSPGSAALARARTRRRGR
jgi:hypothetical protein